jgi:hypothetical protein
MYVFGDPVVRLIPVIQFENHNQRLRQALCRPLHIRSKLLYVRLRPSDDIEPQSVQGVQLFNHCPSGNVNLQAESCPKTLACASCIFIKNKEILFDDEYRHSSGISGMEAMEVKTRVPRGW